MERPFFALLLSLCMIACAPLLLTACENAADDDANDDDSAGDDDDDVADDDDNADDDASQFPSDPSPITITLSGTESGDIVFDTPTCSMYVPPENKTFRTFWRGNGHNAVLIAQVLGNFDGAGNYNANDHTLQIMLQAEAGKPYWFYYVADPSMGHTLGMKIDYVDQDIVWGEINVEQMNDPVYGGDITISPTTIPIWCDDIQAN